MLASRKMRNVPDQSAIGSSKGTQPVTEPDKPLQSVPLALPQYSQSLLLAVLFEAGLHFKGQVRVELMYTWTMVAALLMHTERVDGDLQVLQAQTCLGGIPHRPRHRGTHALDPPRCPVFGHYST